MAAKKNPQKLAQLDRYLYGNIWAHFALILILGLAGAIRLWHIEQSPIPLALDPLYHMADSAALLEEGRVTPWSGFDLTHEPSSNPRLLSIFAAGFALIGIDLMTFYRYGGLILSLAIGVAFYFLLRQRFRAWVAVAGTSVLLFAPYVTHRTILTLPENLHLVFFLFVLLLLTRFHDARLARNRWWLGVGLIALLGLDLATHQTAFLTVSVIALYLIFRLFQTDRGWLGGGLLMIGAILGLLLSSWIPGTWGFHWPASTLLAQHLGLVVVGGGVIGLLSLGGALIGEHRRDWPLVGAILIPLVGLWLFYRGQAEFIGGIEAERVYLYAALLVALGVTVVMEIIARHVRLSWVTVPLYLAFLSFTLLPRWSAPWPQVFHADEILAIERLATLTDETSLSYSQPILSWLIRSVGHRQTLGNGFRQTPVNLRDSSIQELQTDAQSRGVSDATIVFSRYQNDPEFLTAYSDGTLRATDFSDWLELPGTASAKFSCLPVLYENNGVVIYDLPVTESLPAACGLAS